MFSYTRPLIQESLVPSPFLKPETGFHGSSAFGTKTLKVLIVENDMSSASDLRDILEEVGHEVIGIASTSREAMKVIKNETPDIAIIKMSFTKNDDAGVKIAGDIQLQHWLPIIYLAAYPDLELIQKASNTQPSAYLFKPFRPNELLIQVGLVYENFGNKSLSNIEAAGSDSFYFPTKNGHERVRTSEVLFLRAQGHCTDIHLTTSKNPQMIGTNLGTLVKYFTTSNFLRLSKSLFINLDHLRHISRSHIYLGEDRLSLEISEATRKELLKRLQVIRTK